MGARQVAPLTFLDGKETPDGVTEFGPVITHVEQDETIPPEYSATSGSYMEDVRSAKRKADLPPLEDLTHPLDATGLGDGAEPAAEATEPVVGLEDLDTDDGDDFFAEPDPKD